MGGTRGKGQYSEDNDVFGNLPRDVIDNILKCLSMRDAARTSILSRKWRDIWLTIPNLVFDYDTIGRHEYLTDENVECIIHRVLSSHKGPIQEFELSVYRSISRLKFNNWIHLLSKHDHLQELSVSLTYPYNMSWPSERYLIPIQLFDFKKLKHLTLFGCELTVPCEFKGLPWLSHLCLYVKTTTDELCSFISKCPLLEHLMLHGYGCAALEDLIIDAPNLKTFQFNGDLNSVILKYSPLIEEFYLGVEAYIYNSNRSRHNLNKLNGSKFVHNFYGLLSLTELRLMDVALQLVTGDAPEKLPHNLNHLKNLYLQVDLREVPQIAFVVCLIRSSPNLENLTIISMRTGEYDPALQFVKAQQRHKISLNRLKSLRLFDFGGFGLEIEFAKLLVMAASELKYLEIGNLGEMSPSHAASGIMAALRKFISPSTQTRY